MTSVLVIGGLIIIIALLTKTMRENSHYVSKSFPYTDDSKFEVTRQDANHMRDLF